MRFPEVPGVQVLAKCWIAKAYVENYYSYLLKLAFIALKGIIK